ncbi:helix-turn-helix domain-containing protein [Microbacterium fluvii]|uniref:Helix-turn-helix domain-containing protein n=1 Tax=Microbacterium fluvii TaxID=415215 RepID=A0ABW2HH26_9MICO|nr:XRE family transcriptional regulator [Microbacterium fluvii]MCU4672722.1 XRE family transcriptional regulator [Microbacterium fluvii]
MAMNDVVARNLKRFRGDRDLSLGELSRRSGLAKQTIVAIEAGRSNPTVDTLERLADALDISIRALLSEMGTEILTHSGRDIRWQQQAGAQVRQLDQAFGSGYVVNAVLRLTGGDQPFLCPARGRAALRHCYVLEGIVRMGPVSDPVVVDAGDFVRFPADADHVFEARTPVALVFVNTTAPQLSMAGGGRVF